MITTGSNNLPIIGAKINTIYKNERYEDELIYAFRRPTKL